MGKKDGFKSRTIENILFFLLILAYFALQVLTTVIGRTRYGIYNGVVVCFQFFLLLLMIKVNSRRGRHVSWFCLAITMTLLIMAIFRLKSSTPIPGFFMICLFALMATLMSYQIELLDKRMVADYVTSLNNSRGLILTLKKKIYNKDAFNLIYIEVENFKFLNDNYGFDFGDEIRKLVTKRIKSVIKGHGVAGCVDRSSFLVVLNDDCDAKEVASSILKAIDEKISIKTEGTEIDSYLSSYAGISRCPADSSDAETIMKYADIAVTHAVASKKERIVFYDVSMEKKLKRQIEIEKIIKSALANERFYLVFQPQFSTKGKKLRGFEALLRLKMPNGKNLPPAEFIPAAEKNDLILEITDWVLLKTLETFADLVKNTKLIISINVSSKNMERDSFVKKVRDSLKKSGFPPENLEIEITEYCLLDSFEQTIKNIKAFRAMGVKVALDDFGTGYSSLSYLEKLPINLLKIDKTLVDDIEESIKIQQFVNAVIYMGHLMGCEVICEGVESQGQLDLLKENKSDYIQGFVWGRPLEFEKAKELLKD